MTEELDVAPAVVRGLGDRQSEVAAALGGLTGVADVVGVGFPQSHGVIAAPVHSALTSTLASRDSTFRTAQSTSDALDRILRQAAELYERGDEEGARELEQAAAALEAATNGQAANGQGGAASADGTAGSGPGAEAGAAGTGGEAAGQIAGQIGQQVGSVASAMGQAVTGLMQGLAAIPAMAMQAAQGAGGIGQPRADAALGTPSDPTADPATDERDREPDAEEQRDERDAEPGDPSAHAEPDVAAGAERAPLVAPESPPAERTPPAQTRPAALGGQPVR